MKKITLFVVMPSEMISFQTADFNLKTHIHVFKITTAVHSRAMTGLIPSFLV